MIWKLLAAFVCLVSFATTLVAEEVEQSRGDLLIVQGESGTDEYGRRFSDWAERWEDAAQSGGFNLVRVEVGPEEMTQREQFLSRLKEFEGEAATPLWIVLIGHGTFDGKRAKFNLVGPDITAREFALAVTNVKRPLVILNCSSASAPFVAELSGKNRVVLTATRSGDQVNFSHFGEYLSAAINDLTADLDKDEQVSLLEAFLMASRRVEEFYEADGRIPTENALLDDNGDQLGTRASAFRGLRATAQPGDNRTELDGFRAHQLHLVANDIDRSLSPDVIAKRNEIEARIEQLRLRKPDLPENQYYQQLEKLFLEMADVLLPEFSREQGLSKQPGASSSESEKTD